MSREDLEARRGLTFGQAEGVEPLPMQLARGQITPKTKAKLWEIFEVLIRKNIDYSRTTYQSYIREHVRTILVRYYVDFDHKFADSFPSDPGRAKDYFRNIFLAGTYVNIFNFIQHVLQCSNEPNELSEKVDKVLKDELSAYRVYDYNLIAPVGSDVDANSIQTALAKTRAHGAQGARSHIRNAIQAFNSNDYPSSIEHSISAIESLARIISGEPKAELGKALSRIDQSANIHGSMKIAFTKLYGYTSDEEGLRHSLLYKEKADADEADALFMISACSAFATYLIARATEAGISLTDPA